MSSETDSRYNILIRIPQESNYLYIRLTAIIVLVVLLSGCAAVGPPGGGPEDKTGPLMVSTYPENGSVNVDRKSDITMTFSENIESRSAENSLVVMPTPERQPVVKVNRKRLSIHFLDPLKENTTYIVSFGRNIKDYQSNSSERNIVLAFSTGDSIDEGSIGGRVFDIPQKHNPQVWAFRKNGAFPDSILGAVPDYVTAVEKDGTYYLSSLASGEYRLLAISSESAKIVAIDENCLFGLPTIDPVTIANRNDMKTNLNFRLGHFYIKPFRLQKANVIENKIDLLFSRNLDPNCINDAKISIDKDGQIQSFWLNPADSKSMIIKARGLVQDTVYTVKIDSLFDDKSNLLSNQSLTTFTWNDGVDTLNPKIISTIPAKSAKNVALSENIRIVFDEATEKSIPDSAIQIVSNDSVVVDFVLKWSGDNSIILEPAGKFASGMGYQMKFDCSDLVDLSGNPFADSLFTLTFTTVDANSFGSISGKINVADSTVSGLMLTCSPDKDGSTSVSVPVLPSSNYIIESLLPGAYRFEIWEDCNSNKQWDPGRIMPFRPAEPYRNYPNKANVRARWETAEVDWMY